MIEIDGRRESVNGAVSIQGSLDKFPDFFCMGTFIDSDSTHMKP